MANVFITGSADGLGMMAAQLLITQGHSVVLHARNEARGRDAMNAAPSAAGLVLGDLSSMRGSLDVAAAANEFGTFDAVIHNAGAGYREPARDATADDLPRVFAVNTMAPYLLTARMHRPKRLVYVSSALHRSGDASLRDLAWRERRWNGTQAYSDTKLHDMLIAFYIARAWPDVVSNSVEPGWVATKMGGAGAPDDLAAGPRTQVWLAVSNDKAALVSGRHFYHQRERAPLAAALDVAIQNQLIAECSRISGVEIPTPTSKATLR